MDVETLRGQIPACQKMIYMNTGWQGPCPVSVVKAVTERLEYESYEGPTTREVYESSKALQLKAREAVARLLNATVDEIALTPNTTEGLNLVLNGLTWQEGDEIITCGLEHSSVLVPSYLLRERYGVQVNVLHLDPAEEHPSILRKVEQAFTPRTRMVFVSHIQYSTGLRMPVEGIRELTRDRGVLLLLDAAQGAGHVALDMRQIDCEFYSIPGQKWLLGPAGTGALYIRQDMIPQVRSSKGSFGTALSHDSQGGFEPNVQFINKLGVTTSSVPLWAGFVEAIRLTLELGAREVEDRILALAATLKGELSQIAGVSILSPLEGPGCSGLVSFAMEGMETEDVVSHLWDDYRVVTRSVAYPPGVRLSVCSFNTEAEIGEVARALRELANSHHT